MKKCTKLAQFTLLSIALVTACSDATRENTPENTGTGQAAITGGSNDPSTPNNNVVVQLNAYKYGWRATCSGTLITPTAVLTAGHCVLSDGSGPGFMDLDHLTARMSTGDEVSASPNVSMKGYTSDGTHFDPFNDIGVVFLDEAERNDQIASSSSSGVYAEWRRFMGATIRRPSFVAPSTTGNGYPSTPVAFAGFTDAHATPQVASLDTIFHDANGWRTATNIAAHPENGDSGGPLFTTRADGSRDPFGVTSHQSTNQDYESWTVFTDITQPSLAAWLETVLEDHDHDQQPKWLAKHPANGAHRWRGEVDYVGPLPAGKSDKDGDYWFDEHDNCPSTSNIDQADAHDYGFGDACPDDLLALTLSTYTPSLYANHSTGFSAKTSGGIGGTVSFSTSPLPTWLHARFGTPITVGQSTGIAFAADLDAPATEIDVTITATAQGVSRSRPVAVTILACQPATQCNDNCGIVTNGCGGTMDCGKCPVCTTDECRCEASGGTWYASTCHHCSTPAQCCVQAGNTWHNGKCQ